MKLVCRVVYVFLPMLLLLALVSWTASNAGSYRSTWLATFWALDKLAPQYQPINDFSVSMYQVNDAIRRVAHILIGLIAIIIMDRILRVITRMKGAQRLVIACCLSLIVIGIGAAVRYRSSLRHVRTVQFVSSATGMLAGIAWICVAAIDRRIVACLQDASPEVAKSQNDDRCLNTSREQED